MMTPEQTFTDPLTLLPKVLNHLTSLEKRPSLASSVFATIRKTFRTTKSQPFITPLLPPLTAIALTSPLTNVRNDAARTCAALLRALVSRRVNPLAAAYVEDLVALAHRLVNTNDHVPPLFQLPTYFELAKTKTNHNIATDTNCTSCTIARESLEAIFHLLSHFIPITEPQLSRQDYANSDISQAATTRLWVCIGISARASILQLAASYTILSGRCGEGPSRIAVNLLEQALDQRSICAVPAPCLANIRATVEAILRQSFSPLADDTAKRRNTLYRIAQLASAEFSLSAKLWTSCGIREAGRKGALGDYLMKLSHQGMVQPYFPNSEENAKEWGSSREPAKKKRKLTPHQVEDSHEGKETSSAESSQLPSVDASQRAVAGLQRSLQRIDSIYACLEDAMCMRLLGRACFLSADSLNIITRNRIRCSKSFRDWISFASSLGLIARDLASGVNASIEPDIWAASLELCEGIIRLLVALRSVESMASHIHGMRDVFDMTPVITASKHLLVGFTTIVENAAMSLESVKEFPVFALGELLVNLGNFALSKDIGPIEDESFLRACSCVQDSALERESFNSKSQAALIRGSTHACFATSERYRAQRAKQALPLLTRALSTNVTATTEVMAATALALADTLCILAGCCYVHGSKERQKNILLKEFAFLDSETWTKTCNAIVPFLKGPTDTRVLIASLRCFGSLALHSPSEKIGFCVSVLWDTLWCHGIQDAQDLVCSYIQDMLKYRSDARTMLRIESYQNASSSNCISMQTACDRRPTNENEDKGFIFNLLEDIGKHVEKWEQDRDGGTNKRASTYAHPITVIMRLATEVFTSPKLTGLSIHALLWSSFGDFVGIRAILTSGVTSPDKVRRIAISKEYSCLSVWLSTMRAIAVQSGYFGRVSKEASENIFYTKSGMMHSQRASSFSLPTLTQVVIAFLTSRFREWLPQALPKMLNDVSFASTLARLLTDGDSKALWAKVPRHTMELLLSDHNMVLLEMLASKVEMSKLDLIEKVSADALSKVIMNQEGDIDATSSGSNALIVNLLQQPLKSVFSKRAGKIVQKLVMEFGTCEETRAKRGLTSLSRLLNDNERKDLSPESAAGALLSQHFMLVMDAVNRGLFHSKASSTDRFRYMRMLEVVISISSGQLHLFVPKILATLKLALQKDSADYDFRVQTLKVWIGFLKTLGPNRMLPHLGSILSTLLPFYSTYNEILAPSLPSLIEQCSGQQMNNRRDVVLLLRVTDHDDLKRSAAILEASANGVLPFRRPSQVQRQMSVKELSLLTRSVGSVIAHLENGTIEVVSARYLLRMLQESRELLCSAAIAFGEYQDCRPSEEVEALASLGGSLIDLLARTKNAECQKVLMQCIGEIGALDPTTVCEMYQGVFEEVEQEKTALSLKYPTSLHALVALLLDNFLVPNLTKGERQDRSRSRQNRVGLVIQELLRVCGCERDTAKRASKNLWSRRAGDAPVEWEKVLIGETADENAVLFWENLLTTTRNVAEPYLDEPFDVQHYRGVFGGSAAGDTKTACQPVWAKVKIASPAGQIPTAQEWRRQMIVQLVDFIGTQGVFGEVLKALRPVLRYEDDIAAFIFPLVIVTTIDVQQSNEENEVSQFLITEIAEVLEEGSSPQPLFDLFDILRHWRDQRCLKQARVTSMTNPSILNRDGTPVISHRKKIPLEAYVEVEKDRDPLSAFVDLNGRESGSLSLFLQATSAFRAKSYSRAVMMAETHIRNMRSKKGFAGWPSFIDDVLRRNRDTGDSRLLRETEVLRLLQKAFAELEDAENMKAIAALRGSSSLAEQVIDCEAAGRYDEALTTYERAIASQPHSIGFHEGFLGCLMTLGHWESMLSHAKGLLSFSSLTEMELRETARANGIAAAWRLGRWSEMEDFSHNSFDPGILLEGEESHRCWALRFTVSLGEMLLSLRNGRFSTLYNAANEARRHMLSPTVKAAREGYSRAYPMIALLHSVSDIEDSCRVLESYDNVQQNGETAAKQCISSKRLISFSSRTESSKRSLKAREPLISIKRVCYELLKRPNDGARANLELALLAREEESLHAASASVHRAMSSDSINNAVRNETVLEMARIQRAQGDCSVALKTVKVEIERLLSVLNEEQVGVQDSVRETSDRLCTALVLAGCWIEETRGEPSEVILSYFERAAAYGPTREEPFYSLGRHYDSLLQASANSDEKNSKGSGSSSGRMLRRSDGQSDAPPHHSVYVPLIIKSFTQALVNGHTRIFEALPRMLTVWFDYQTELDDANSGGSALAVESDVKQEMKRAFERIPGYMWMTAVPQIMSRILHPRKQVREDLTMLLAKLVCLFPDQCFWTILPSSQLKSAERKRAAGNILNQSMAITKKKGKPTEAREKARVLRSRIQSALSVVTSFVGICMNLLPKEKRGRRENCCREFMELKSYLQSNMAMNPIIPTLESLTTRLPYGEVGEHRAFEEEPVRIVDIEDYVLVMVSLMRPRRIGLVGSDGRCYRYLAKKENQGDMRKDSRLVELITVVNRLLTKNGTWRGKKLGLKTYAVLPLSEETGMIEWVNDLAPLRNVVRDEHNRLGVVPETQEIQRKYQGMASHRKFLVDWAFVKFPAVLDKFFLRRFGQGVSAEAWLTARNVWTESTAVWSMVGYVVGLGDRHGENVLLETTSGRCVHVDFAMLFDKGLKLKVPEIVPFRLTRNMVTAMGIAGYEGVYRGVSESVLGIMRRKADGVLGVLESFLHDPLADWGRNCEARVNKGGILATKEAWQTRAAVKDKLMGMMDNSGLALSIKGQVERLIEEATNVDKLSEMYVWWSAWI